MPSATARANASTALIATLVFALAPSFALAQLPVRPPADTPASSPTRSTSFDPLAGFDYVEPFTATDPASVFGGVLDVGRLGAWTGSLTGAGYRLANLEEPGAVRYYYQLALPGIAGPLAQGIVSVDVHITASGGPLAAAGLLFDFDADARTYLAFTITPTGYAILQRGADGLELLTSSEDDAVRPDTINRLTLSGRGEEVEFLVNGERMVTLTGTTPFAGGIGIIGVGAVDLLFRDLGYRAP